MMTPAPDAARFAAGGGGDLDGLESRIWAHVKHVCSPSHKGRVSTLVKVYTHTVHDGQKLLAVYMEVCRCLISFCRWGLLSSHCFEAM